MIYFLAITLTILFVGMAIFQVLLSCGFPYGEVAMGGNHRILPTSLRIVSAVSACVLLFMGLVFLLHVNILTLFPFLPTHGLIWVVTIYLALNTIANIASQSKKERLIMTPLSGVAFLLCFMIAIA
ncbi:hypothetical protein [Halalkalibacter akibai]|uniref:hypothetical protein n=1 Tax=Halalkalibacter akibai TaxID=1411 RepID=UPI0004B8CDB1|nr:hypothetical protein [Halalkalibacter akibai]